MMENIDDPPVPESVRHDVGGAIGSASSKLRPVEARVLRLLDEGLTLTEVAVRFQRPIRWVEQVAALGRWRSDNAVGEQPRPQT